MVKHKFRHRSSTISSYTHNKVNKQLFAMRCGRMNRSNVDDANGKSRKKPNEREPYELLHQK